LSHDGGRCAESCRTCRYWEGIWSDAAERKLRLNQNAQRIRSFRNLFPELLQVLPSLMATHPALLSKLYSDCQSFAEMEIKSLLEKVDLSPPFRP